MDAVADGVGGSGGTGNGCAPGEGGNPDVLGEGAEVERTVSGMAGGEGESVPDGVAVGQPRCAEGAGHHVLCLLAGQGISKINAIVHKQK